MTDRLRETDDLTSWLRDEAVNIDSAVDEHMEEFGDYCRSHGDHFSSVAIIEYQLNKNHLGEEAIKLREAAEVIERQGNALRAVEALESFSATVELTTLLGTREMVTGAEVEVVSAAQLRAALAERGANE